jgi:hypothetical protein
MIGQHSRLRQSDVPRARYLLCLAALVTVGMGGGCAHVRLERNTISQGSTLTDLQYKQVLDNLAMFACVPESLAWHIKITGGVVQVADQGSGFLGGNLGGPGVFAPNFGLQRNVLNQWNVDPVTDSDDLELLQLAYRKAVNPADADGSIRHEMYGKIVELSTNFHIALSREVVSDLLENSKLHARPAELPRLEKLQVGIENLYGQIEELSERAQSYEPDHAEVGGAEATTKLEFLKDEAIRQTSEIGHSSTEPARSFRHPGRNAGLIEQAQGKIEALLKLSEVPPDGPNPFSMCWLHQGGRKDVPACACLVGRYRGCGCECFVWVTPDHMKEFRDFTLIVLSLAPSTAQDMAASPAGLGAANSPNF